MTNSHTEDRQDTGSRNRTPLLTWLACLCLTLFSHHSFAEGLTLAQDSQARAMSSAVSWQGATGSRRSLHPLGLQTLFVEKQEKKSEPGVRWVHVFQYHYAHRSARRLLIDLTTGSVEKEQTVNSVHLPLNSTEIDFARNLVLQDPTVMQQLHDEQIKRGQPQTQNLTELDVKASIYEPWSSSHPCHTQRCALLSLFDHSNTVFSMEPVVLLDTLQVQLLEPR